MGRPRKRPKTDEECRAEVEAMLAKAQGRIDALRSLLTMVGGVSEDDEGDAE